MFPVWTTTALALPGKMGDASLCPSSQAVHRKLSRADAVRAASDRARLLTATTPAEIAEKINRRLDATAPAKAPCDSFKEAELDELFRLLYCHRSPELESAYSAGDGRMLLHETIEQYERRWAKEYAIAAGRSPGNYSLKEGKCAHTLMVWTHHLTEAGKAALLKIAPTLKLPSLPVYNATAAVESDKSYAQSFTCVTGHNNTGRDSDHVWPHWPEEVRSRRTTHTQRQTLYTPTAQRLTRLTRSAGALHRHR